MMQKNLLLLLSVCATMFLFSAIAIAAPCTEAGSMRRVYKQAAGNYEYVVFELIRPAKPEFEVRTEHQPFYEDGPGDPVEVKGRFFKEVDFRGVVWTCDISESLSLRTSAIVDVKKSGQFEGYITYVVGYAKRGQYVSSYARNVGKYRRYYLKFKR